MAYELIIMTAFAYSVMSCWTIWFDMKKPILMPFSVFKWICSLGYKAPINDLPPEMDGLNKFGFVNDNFQKWFTEIKIRECITRLEFFAFNQQRLTELDAEIARRGL